MMYRLIRPLLFLLDPEVAHRVVIKSLKYLTPFLPKRSAPSMPVSVFGLQFPGSVGLAAGFDKNGEAIDALLKLGFAFVEVGTVTPRPQVGNPKQRLFRLSNSQAVINRMGFNNAGVDALVTQLKARRVPGIVGVNIGKNKSTPNEKAFEDYLICLEKVYPYADYITINISSPNTPGLRDLHAEDALDHLLLQLLTAREKLVQQYHVKRPMLVKVSPDLSREELKVFVDIIQRHGIDGIIACNTSVDHSLVEGEPHAKEQGGLSGKPIHARAVGVVKDIAHDTHGQLPIIGVGGVDSKAAAERMFSAGASLVQVYSALVYHGLSVLTH